MLVVLVMRGIGSRCVRLESQCWKQITRGLPILRVDQEVDRMNVARGGLGVGSGRQSGTFEQGEMDSVLIG